MKKKKIISMLLAAVCVASLLTGCTGENTNTADKNEKTEATTEKHEAITMGIQARNIDSFLDLVEEKYPEINLEIIPYNGANGSMYMSSQLEAGDTPDIYSTTAYMPGLEDLSDKLIDLSSYSFTNAYSEVRLQDVVDNGAIYLLPTYYTCIGITYNKTILEENGWELPTTWKELEELAPKVKEAGYNLALNELQYPGIGFQFMCNVLDTTYFNTMQGRQWQKDYLEGEATVADSPEMKEALSTLDKWKELGMLTGEGNDPDNDDNTKAIMAEGNTLFLLGSNNTITKEESEDEFGLMPYLSEDGTQNALIVSVTSYIGLNKHLEEKGNEQKLEDALHVMELISSVEGLASINQDYAKTSLLPLADYTIPEDNYYKDLEDDLNAGKTAPFIYSGWEDIIVPIGNEMISYINGDATLDDLSKAIDDNQKLLTDNENSIYTRVTEKLTTDDCAKWIGICFAKASGADLALISKNKWYKGAGELNKEGVSGELFALPIADKEITIVLPTGWRDDIQTVTLTGKRVKELAESGYDRKGEGYLYPYELVTPEGMEIEDDVTYTVAICGVADDVAEEGNLTDTGILGLTAAEEYLSQFETFSKKDIVWE